jgi:hypothetical protein
VRGGDRSGDLYGEEFFRFRIQEKDTVSSVDWICSRSVTSRSRQPAEEEKGQPDTRHERQNFVLRY